MDKLKKKLTVNVKMSLLVTFIVFTVSVSATIAAAYRHLKTLEGVYSNETQNGSEAAAQFLTDPETDDLADLIISKQFQEFRAGLSESGDYSAIGKYIADHGLGAQQERTKRILVYITRILDVDDTYLIACDTDQACYVFADAQDNYDYIGKQIPGRETLDQFSFSSELETSNDSEEGYLLSAYTPMRSSGSDAVLLSGCDTDLRRMAMTEYAFTGQVGIVLLLVSIVFAIISARIMHSQFTKPIVKIKNAAVNFRNAYAENQETNVIDPGIRTHDEIEELSDSLVSLQEGILETSKELRKESVQKGKMKAELTIAHSIQQGILPQTFPPFPDRKEFDIYATMKPARQVGGDFYDFYFVDESHLALVIGDVSDKGIPAAMFMMVAKTLLKQFAMSGLSPNKVLESVNERMIPNNKEDMFVTVWIGIIDLRTGLLTAASAGHEYPLLKRAGKQYEVFKDPHGMVLCTLPGMKYKNYEIMMNPGDEIFVYSDGAPDAVNTEGVQFTVNGIEHSLNEANAAASDGVVKSLTNDITAFTKGAEQFDDITLLSFRFLYPQTD